MTSIQGDSARGMPNLYDCFGLLTRQAEILGNSSEHVSACAGCFVDDLVL